MTGVAGLASSGQGRAEQARAARARPRRRIPTAVLLLYALCLGGGLGIGSVLWILDGDYPFGRVRVGPWTAWPASGSPDADPYMRAIVAKRGDLPLGLGEGLALLAATDGAGEPLEARCRYRLDVATPTARAWTLSLYDEAGRPLRSERGWSALTSSDVVRDRDGRAAIALSREAVPGNWLRLPDGGRVGLVLRLYDTPVATGSAGLDPRSFPSIQRLGCDG